MEEIRAFRILPGGENIFFAQNDGLFFFFFKMVETHKSHNLMESDFSFE